MKKNLKIVSDGMLGRNVRVFGVITDGEEETVEDLTDVLCIHRIQITLDVNNINNAILHCYVQDIEVEAELSRIERIYSDEVPD